MKSPYEDILHLSRPISKKHSPMPMSDRAAQFSSFAALSGYEAAITETARLTDQKHEPSEEVKAQLDRKQAYLNSIMEQRPIVCVTYFAADNKKAGGAYQTAVGVLKRVDEYAKRLIFTDGTTIALEDIAELESECFRNME